MEDTLIKYGTYVRKFNCTYVFTYRTYVRSSLYLSKCMSVLLYERRSRNINLIGGV